MSSHNQQQGPNQIRLPSIRDLLSDDQAPTTRDFYQQRPGLSRHQSSHLVRTQYMPSSWSTVNTGTPIETLPRGRNDSFIGGSLEAAAPDEDGYLLTPNTSRTNSVGGGSPGAGHIARPSSAASALSSADHKKTWCKSCHVHNCKEHTSTAKGIKEKERRKVSQVYLQEVESLIELLVAYTPKKSQSTGNGNSAGLYTDKDELIRITLGLLSSILHEGYVEAIEQGTLEEWQTRFKNKLVKCRGASSILEGTYLFDQNGSNEPCDKKDTRSRDCIVHNHPDWRECRHSRLRRKHDNNLARAHPQRAPYVRRTTELSRSRIID